MSGNSRDARLASGALAVARHAPGRNPSSTPWKIWRNGWLAFQFDRASPVGGIPGLEWCQGAQQWRCLVASMAGWLPLTRLQQDASALFAWARAVAIEACHCAQDVEMSVVQPRLHHRLPWHQIRGPRQSCYGCSSNTTSTTTLAPPGVTALEVDERRVQTGLKGCANDRECANWHTSLASLAPF